MSLGAQDVAAFRTVADELVQTFEERGHRVEQALEADPYFETQWTLLRDLAAGAASKAASQVGLDFRTISGGGKVFRAFDGMTDRRFRLRKATLDRDGLPVIPHNSKSALGHDGEDGLLPSEDWVFAYVLDDGLIADVFLAPVTGHTQGNPGQLILGPQIALLSGTVPTAVGFTPAEEDLDLDIDFGQVAGE